MSSILLPNQPFKLVISMEGVNPTADGFATFSWFGKRMKLYEKVDLDTYPSMKDFKGNSFYFDIDSNEEKELVTFKDYFVVGENLASGDYILELFIENPLLNKNITLVKKFKMLETV